MVMISPLLYVYVNQPGARHPSLAAALPGVGVAGPWPDDSASPDPVPSGSAQSAPPSPTADAASSSPAPASTTASSAASAAAPATSAGAPASSAPPAAAAPVTVSRISGVGCANDESQNWYTNAQDGSWTEKAGGAAECGRALAMPMSGSADYDTDPYVVWWFVTTPVVIGSCAVSVYIPSTGVAGDVAGHPAYYKILGGRTSSTVYGRFTVDQTVNRGRWVNAGTYAVHNGELSVHLVNRGANPNGERIGAAQVRLSCTAGGS
jgi:translation initiation factor IF-2